jgi:hypothetical protein
MRAIILIITLLIFNNIFGQENKITSKLYETYGDFKELSLDNRRIKYHDLQPLITNLKNNSKFIVQKVGESIEGRDLTLISIGSGDTNVFLWSQMHGDEPTATQAIFDIINFFNGNKFIDEKKAILDKLTIHFLPMLNPDGAELFKRRNSLDIDINRDALRLQSPESQILKKIRDSLNADFGFNLHDQSKYYNAERTDKPATITYLAPAYNYKKDINDIRANAMRVIVYMNSIIQKYAPGQVGRYDDEFEPRAFGDNIQKWGTSTILIESGGLKDDPEKQEIRKLNYVSILSALYTIAHKSYTSISIDEYENIPHNDRKLFDLKINNVTYNLASHDYVIDIGINYLEIDNAAHSDFYTIGKIKDQGDLSTYYGYQTFDASGYTLIQGKVYPKTVKSMDKLNSYDLLKSGYTYVRMKKLPKDTIKLTEPIIIINKNYKLPEFELLVGKKSTFLLQKNDRIEYAIINGYLIDLSKDENSLRNTLIYR